MATSYYSSGTISLTNGSAVVTGNGTAWQTALIDGGNIFPVASGMPLPIASVDSNTQITAEFEWVGATGTYEYRIQRDTAYLKTLDRNSENVAYLLDELRKGTLFKYDASGTLADRSLFDGRPKGFSYLVLDDDAELWVKASNTSGDWSGPYAYGTGPAGPMGPGGYANPRGDYDPDAEYERNDAVLFNGSSYVARQDVTGIAPPALPATSNAYWQLTAVKGMDGTGIGDMLVSTYDPTGKDADAFDRSNHHGSQSVGTVTGAFAEAGGILRDTVDATKSAKFLLSGVAAGQQRSIRVPNADVSLSKWEVIGEYNAVGMSSIDVTGLAAFRKIRLSGVLHPSVASTVSLLVSEDNGSTWVSGAGAYQVHAILAGISGGANSYFSTINTIDIGIGGTISTNSSDALGFALNIENFNVAARMKSFLSSAYVSSGGQNTYQTAAYYRLSTVPRNAIRLIAGSGNLSGNVLFEGVRG